MKSQRMDEQAILRSAQDDMSGGEGMRYLGDGEFLPGVPARDLTADEARQWAAVLASPTGRRLYGPLGAIARAITVEAVEAADV